jgi:SAM-dependent methyltransferase
MAVEDLVNARPADSVEGVDALNKRFYGRFNYPPQLSMLPAYPAGVVRIFLNQDIGCWTHDRIPPQPRIWVAGCGTNQALLTALKFPEASVLGTDISTTSLSLCRSNAQKAGVTNLQLEERSLNEVDYEEAFDYILCTGVIHHNAEPARALRRIGRALTKRGVLELMVYNYYHRVMATACQKAIRAFYDSDRGVDLDLELSLIRQLMDHYPHDNSLGQFIKSQADVHEARLADTLLQPVEYSYTVESLGDLASDCNLEYLTSCLNQFDVAKNACHWNTTFASDDIRRRYDALPDRTRWQITNILMYTQSPMLWFYFQRRDAIQARQTERELCEAFLETRFRRYPFAMKHWVLGANQEYTLTDSPTTPRPAPRDETASRVLQAATPDRPMKDVLNQLNVTPTFHTVNNIRLRVTTSAFAYLAATHD